MGSPFDLLMVGNRALLFPRAGARRKNWVCHPHWWFSTLTLDSEGFSYGRVFIG
jgi:hypothetical protein